MQNEIIREIRNNLIVSLEIINRMITTCPNDLWEKENKNHISIAKRVLHVLESLDYRVGNPTLYLYKNFGQNNRPQIQDKEVILFTKSIANEYFAKIAEKVSTVLNELTLDYLEVRPLRWRLS